MGNCSTKSIHPDNLQRHSSTWKIVTYNKYGLWGSWNPFHAYLSNVYVSSAIISLKISASSERKKKIYWGSYDRFEMNYIFLIQSVQYLFILLFESLICGAYIQRILMRPGLKSSMICPLNIDWSTYLHLIGSCLEEFILLWNFNVQNIGEGYLLMVANGSWVSISTRRITTLSLCQNNIFC